jgi:hypothetical protein
MTTGTEIAHPFVTAPNNTVANIVEQALPANTPVTGTVGHRGVVEYSKAATATVKETYVVTTKK